MLQKSVPVPSRLLVARFVNKATNKSVEVWKTTCIVTNFGKSTNICCTGDDDDGNIPDNFNCTSSPACTVLINPANPELSGVSRFAYFPAGGPLPKSTNNMHANSWGGMDAGNQMLYPVQVVDGLVHQLGGMKLDYECKLIRMLHGGCPIGTAISTSQGDTKLKQEYDRIIHTSPPFYKYDNGDKDPSKRLKHCYRSALDLAFSYDDVKRVACPLIGAGARGFPLEIAIDVAVSELSIWGGRSYQRSDGEHVASINTVAFGIQELSTAEKLARSIEDTAESWG